MENNNIKIEDLISSVRKANRRANVSLIIKAYKYANAHHTGQSRASGVPYIVHPLNVALILTELHLDDATICAALLHDVVEDTPITKEDIIKEFGLEISEMVEGVTKLSKLQYSDKEERQVEDYRKMFLAMGKDIRVILIKLADRLHNMRTLKYIPEDRQLANARETMNLYAPLANRLGIYSIKWELEDLSFKYLYPEEYRELVEGINKKREERLEFIEEITGELKMGLRKERIQGEVTGRAKHLYSIYRKMKRDNVSLDQIYDLFALRILVNTVKDCYAALGIVHELYTPMPGRFKDYIAVPKPNMYQSIHTTVLGKGESPFEIQIRTWEMHQVAETGIAAHWAYKEANKDRKSNVVVVEDKLAWLRETLEWQKDMQDPNEFLARLKTELFEDEVYVFTPRGQIKVLPKGATPIDFAYNIHAEVGHKMVGCKINSKMMPIVTSLNNGDIVEIITSDTSKGPSRDWLKFVKSGSAKNRILQWFKKTQKEENIVKGKDLLDKEIRRIGMSHSDLYRTEWVQIALDRYKFVNQDEMFASIGFGAMSPAKIIAKLLEEYKKEHKEEILEEKIQELSKSKPVQNKNTKTGIIVKGIDNCLVKLSKCCNPLPGDNIVGYITKGRGVSVHRTDCINVNDLLQEEGRMIDVYWYEDKKSLYSVDIQTLATDRIGLVADTLKEMANTKAKITAISCKTDKYGIDTTDLTVEVENLNELNQVLKVLRRIEGVYEVRRKT